MYRFTFIINYRLPTVRKHDTELPSFDHSYERAFSFPDSQFFQLLVPFYQDTTTFAMFVVVGFAIILVEYELSIVSRIDVNGDDRLLNVAGML